MIRSIRALSSVVLLLVAGCLTLEPSPPNEGAGAPLGELGQPLTLPDLVVATELDDGEPPDDPDCCGPMVLPAPADCPRKQWFCNAEGICVCDESIVVADPVGTLALRAARSPVGSARRESGGEAPCACSGASVSEPKGGCAVEDWFCNASGLCRCVP